MELIVGLALATGLYMAWNIGANDVANAMGTSVGSGAVTLRGALIIAAVFEFSGAVLVGTHVTETIRKDILDPAIFATAGPFGAEGPLLLALGMTSALLAAAVWLQVATSAGLPVSTTHSIVGAVIGFGITAAGTAVVEWSTVVEIAASWVISPALGGLLGLGTFLTVRRLVLTRDDPVAATVAVGPYLVGVVGYILALTFVYKALSNVLVDPHPMLVQLSALLVGGLCVLVARFFVRPPAERPADPYVFVEAIFGRLQIVTASFVAFAHGANDVANAIGPLAAVLAIAGAGFEAVATEVPVPRWLLAVGGVGIVVGLATWGYKVIATIGGHITELTPTRGFSAEFGAACTVLLASRMGLPVSTTHILVGAVVGMGLAHGLAALNLRTLRNIAYSWVATLPASAVLAGVIFLLLRALLA